MKLCGNAEFLFLYNVRGKCVFIANFAASFNDVHLQIMINRVLIRIKVVQMLYSYLLTRSEFKMPSLAENPSRDKLFAFGFYHDILAFLLKLSSQHSMRALASNRFLLALKADRQAYDALFEQAVGFEAIEPLVGDIAEQVSKTKAYRSYVRRKDHSLKPDIEIVRHVADVLAKSIEFEANARNINGYTGAGFNSAFDMVEATINDFGDNRMGLDEARHSLDRSLDKAYELYHLMLLLPLEITRLQDQRIDDAKHKYLATEKDMNPDTRFVDNAFVKMLSECRALEDYFKDGHADWQQIDDTLVRRLLDRILESPLYEEYMAASSTSLYDDCELWRNIFKKIIFPGDDLAEALESTSVYWNDDLTVIDTFVLKTIKRAAAMGQLEILPKFKDEEDARFGAELFNSAVAHRDEYRELIDRFIDRRQWDTERLAFMDIVIMIAAITELVDYPAIPVAVTVNEYVEIANCYSTNRSGSFINGILSSVIDYLKREGILNK